MRGRLTSVAVGVLAVATAVWLVVAMIGSAAPEGKSGAGPGTTFQLAVTDGAGTPAARIAERFAARVDSLSNGALDITVSYSPARFAKGTPTWRIEQGTLATVRKGDVQLALVPAHAFGGTRASALRVLQTPFLITSSSVAARVTTGAIGERLRAGLPDLSLRGLALVPEGLYRPFGYLEAPETPGDFAETRIRTSRATETLVRVLGGRPVDVNAPGDTGVYSGFVRGAESSLTSGHAFPRDAFVAANVVLSPKVDVLVGSTHALATLTGAQQAILRRAAFRARAETIASTNERTAAAAFCRAGGTIVAAPASALNALRAKASPLVVALRRDPAAAALLDRIARLAAGSRASPAPCAPSEPAATPGSQPSHAATDVRLPPPGSYRRAFTVAQLRAAGAEEPEAIRNRGVTTLTLYGPHSDRRFALEWLGTARRPCRGRVLPGVDRVVELRWNRGTPCSGYVAFRWRLDAGDLALGAFAPTTETRWLANAYPGTWKRVECAPWIGWPGLDPRRVHRPPCGGGRTRPPSGVTELVFSPDGKHAVFAQASGHGNALASVNVDGTGYASLTRNRSASGRCPCDRSPAFSPRGTRVTFVRFLDDGRVARFVVDADGRRLTRLTPWSREVPGAIDWTLVGER